MPFILLLSGVFYERCISVILSTITVVRYKNDSLILIKKLKKKHFDNVEFDFLYYTCDYDTQQIGFHECQNNGKFTVSDHGGYCV